MTDIERLATTTSNGISFTLRRLSRLVIPVIVVAAIVGLATFLTGAWVFDNSSEWLVIGGIICAIPLVAAIAAWRIVRGTADIAPRLLGELRSFLGSSSSAQGALIDHDTGQALAVQSKDLRQLRTELTNRRHELPALWAGVRAVTRVPGLAAIAFIGIAAVGALGGILLLAGLID